MTLFQLALVYDWGQRGNISQYVASHPGASRPSLVKDFYHYGNYVRSLTGFPRAIQLYDVAKGLQYLHSLDIPHGDLKGVGFSPEPLVVFQLPHLQR